MPSLEEKILKHADFDTIEPHMRRRSVFVVRELSLIDVGEALSKDDSKEVAYWMESGNLSRPSIDEVMRWHASETKFTVLVVQPFVLVKEEFDA